MTDENGNPRMLPPARPSKSVLGRVDSFCTACMPTLWPAFKVIFMVLVGLHVLFFGAVLVNNYLGARELDAARAEAKARGLSLSMQEFLATLPVVPDEGNAAVLYEKAFSLHDQIGVSPHPPVIPFVGYPSALRYRDDIENHDMLERDLTLVTYDPTAPFPPYMLEAAVEHLERRREVIDLVEKAQSIRLYRYHVTWDGNQWDLQGISWMRRTAALMALAAAVSAEDGKGPEAVSRVRQSLAIARSLADEPCFIVAYQEMAVIYMSLGGFTRVVARTDLTNSVLEPIQNDMRIAEGRLSARFGVAGELPWTCFILDPVVSGEASFEDFLKSIGVGLQPEYQPALPRVPNWLVRGFLRRDEALAVRFFTDLYDNASHPSPGFLTRPLQLREPADSVLYPLSEFVLPYHETQVDDVEKTRVRLRSAATCVAALRYRNDHGSWPDSLDAFVPDYMTAVPIDPFTGHALTYRVNDDGVMAYSVGPNLIDDSGKPLLVLGKPGETHGGLDEPDDSGFRIWK